MVAVLAVQGCTKSAPKCTDPRTKATIIEIVQKQEKALRDFSSFLKERIGESLIHEVSNVRYKDFKDKIGTYECAADLRLKGVDKKGVDWDAVLPITYTSELMNDGDEYLVSVRGIEADNFMGLFIQKEYKESLSSRQR